MRAVDKGEYTGAVQLDPAKVFDTVVHTILLKCFGFQGASYTLLCDYLSNGQQ